MKRLSHQFSADGFGSAYVARQLSDIDSGEGFHPIRPRTVRAGGRNASSIIRKPPGQRGGQSAMHACSKAGAGYAVQGLELSRLSSSHP